MNALFVILNVLFLIVILSGAWLFRKFFPKEINNFFGYRTRRSMASQEAWIFANGFASNLMFRLSLVCVLIQVICFILTNARTSILAGSITWLIMLLIVIALTEYRLRKLIA